MSDKASQESERRSPPPSGFSARLSGATLFDLIQFECLERSQRIVRVSDGTRVGLLYFRGGNLVHAAEGREVGEAAVRGMLAWERGVFESWQGPWPERESITLPWQPLLLRAAQAQDETRLPTKVLSFPAPPAAAPRTTTMTGDDEVTKRTGVPGLGEDAPRVALRLSADGALVEGDAPEELVGAVAYAAQLADLVGELMGLEAVQSIEFALSNGACVIAREPQGDLVALRAGRGTDAAALRRALGV